MSKQIETIRHSTAHLMAAAIQKLYPKAKFGIGPSIDEGFYYDIELDEQLSPQDLKKIEKEMINLQKQDLKFEKEEIKIDDAIKLFKKLKQNYKVQLLKDIEKHGTTGTSEIYGDDETAQIPKFSNSKPPETITVYRTGEFTDLCRGPHVDSTKDIKVFKLTKLAGAYWRGDEKNKMLTRIYGTAFEDKKSLTDYLHMLEEAEKRDHKKLGKELGLYTFHDEAPGAPFFHNNGVQILNTLIDFWREKQKARGYQEVQTPVILKRKLWEQSGHWKLYKDDMYTTEIDDEDYAIKPMNCPGGMLIYNENKHSYRELPLRVAELGYVHRHELSGVLNGLFRVRAFTQDDAHIFCAPEQLEDEIIDVIKLIQEIFSVFGFKDYRYTLSVRGDKKKEKYLGADKEWEWAQDAILNAAKKLKIKCDVQEGEAKFYGPSLDVMIKDAIGREWQTSTIQLDFNLPSRFNIAYTGEDGKDHTPYILHRVIYGSLERFLGILVEHYAGAFPAWLSPIQVALLPVSTEKHLKYCEKLADEFREKGVRIWIDDSDETVSKKIRTSEKQKIPYILVVGDKEMNGDKLAVREQGSGNTKEMKIEELIGKLQC
ncbi:threonine--tRNA ligase [Patescibacteria group bacterium]|nr:threonine--tRNA ligase [Patescibacteria group bacterium]